MKRLPAFFLISLVLLSGCSSIRDEDTDLYQYGYEKGEKDGYEAGREDALSELALEHVRGNYSIDEVFTESEIIEYVKEHYDMTDIYDIDDIVDFAADHLIENGFTVIDPAQ